LLVIVDDIRRQDTRYTVLHKLTQSAQLTTSSTGTTADDHLIRQSQRRNNYIYPLTLIKAKFHYAS